MSMETGHPIPRLPDPESVLSAPGDRSHPRHLPPQPTRLIDREEELTRLGASSPGRRSAC